MIPGITPDDKPSAFKLIGIEPFGLWLEALRSPNALDPQFSSGLRSTAKTAFVPFARIGYIVCDGASHSQPLLADESKSGGPELSQSSDRNRKRQPVQARATQRK